MLPRLRAEEAVPRPVSVRSLDRTSPTPLAPANEICSNASESTSPPDVRVAVVIAFTFVNTTEFALFSIVAAKPLVAIDPAFDCDTLVVEVASEPPD